MVSFSFCQPVHRLLFFSLRTKGQFETTHPPPPPPRHDHKESKFEVNEAYAVDIIMSTGEGKAKLREQRTTVYKRTDETYLLKMKASRAFFSEVQKKCSGMPFTLR